MHKTDVNTEISKKQTAGKKGTPPFKSYTHLPGVKRTPEIELLELAKDVANGAGLVLELLERARVDESTDDYPPYLGAFECGALERFAIVGCEMLTSRIERHFDRLRDEARK